MLTTRNLFLSVIIVFLCSCSSLQKHTAQNATTKIYNKVGTIDIDAIHQQVRVINNLNLQKEKAIQKLKTEIDAKESEFDNKRKQIKEKEGSIDKENLLRELQILQMDIMSYDKQISNRMSDIQKRYVNALELIQKQYLNDIVKDIGKKKKLEIVVNGQTAILINESLDITADVIQQLNQQLKDITFETK